MKISHPANGTVIRECGDGESAFKLKLRVPSYDDRIADMALELAAMQDVAAGPAHLEYRFGFVEGWEGVEDDAGAPVAFSRDTLKQAIAGTPLFAYAVHTALRKHFQSRLGEAAAKNSVTP